PYTSRPRSNGWIWPKVAATSVDRDGRISPRNDFARPGHAPACRCPLPDSHQFDILPPILASYLTCFRHQVIDSLPFVRAATRDAFECGAGFLATIRKIWV